MAEKPFTDARFTLIDSRHPYGLWGVVAWIAWVSGWGVAMYYARDPWLRVAFVVASSLYQVIWFFLRGARSPSGAEIDLLRLRLDPRQGWRKTAIRQRR